MIAIISPAKSLNFEPHVFSEFSEPLFPTERDRLVGVMQKKTSNKLQKMMGISKKLGDLNVMRYRNFNDEENNPAKQAVLSFNGDVYTGLDASTFSAENLNFAQSHLRILSGLYGLLRPLDSIKPYRLEMGIKLKYRRKNNLYEFWGDKITEALNQDLLKQEQKVILNLASNEYFKAVNRKKINARIIDFQFREYRDGEYKMISFFAKKARGLVSRYMVLNEITDLESIKGFNLENYSFSEELSSENEWFFVR